MLRFRQLGEVRQAWQQQSVQCRESELRLGLYGIETDHLEVRPRRTLHTVEQSGLTHARAAVQNHSRTHSCTRAFEHSEQFPALLVAAEQLTPWRQRKVVKRSRLVGLLSAHG